MLIGRGGGGKPQPESGSPTTTGLMITPLGALRAHARYHKGRTDSADRGVEGIWAKVRSVSAIVAAQKTVVETYSKKRLSKHAVTPFENRAVGLLSAWGYYAGHVEAPHSLRQICRQQNIRDLVGAFNMAVVAGLHFGDLPARITSLCGKRREEPPRRIFVPYTGNVGG
jgi:hypothetical protein